MVLEISVARVRVEPTILLYLSFQDDELGPQPIKIHAERFSRTVTDYGVHILLLGIEYGHPSKAVSGFASVLLRDADTGQPQRPLLDRAHAAIAIQEIISRVSQTLQSTDTRAGL